MTIAKSVLLPMLAWLLMTGHARYRQLSPPIRRIFLISLIGVAATGIARVSIHAVAKTLHPPLWDFSLFWMNGSIASRGLNFYDPTLAAQVAQSFHPDPGFILEAVATPFLYPPPSIVWFVPLGWLEMHAAAGVWYAAHLACLAASIIVLSLTFFGKPSKIDVAFVTALVLLVHGTDWNIEHAQTGFLLLLFTSLAFRYRSDIWGGIWLGLAILVKPFMMIVVLYALLSRKWRPLAATFMTLAVSALATLVVFGRTVFTSYRAIHFQALPPTFYIEMENQSLMAWILRLSHSIQPFPPAYSIIAVLIAALLIWHLAKLDKENDGAGFALALTAGLLIYPASLRSYTVLLILPILILYRERPWVVLIAFAYALMYLGQGNYVVLATMLIAIALSVRISTPTPMQA